MGLLFVIGGCCSNAYSLEMIINREPRSGNLITASQFLLVTLIELPYQYSLSRGFRERLIPLNNWLLMVFLFFSSSMLNNIALAYHISVPLHIVFRSASLVASMLLGWMILKKKYFFGFKCRYNIQQFISVVLVTIGVILAFV